MMTMRRKILGRTPEEIKKLNKDEFESPVSLKDFTEAISKCKKSVSLKDLNRYQSWVEEFGAC